MDLDLLERTGRLLVAAGAVVAWVEAGIGITAAQRRRQQTATGLAARIGVLPAYLVVAVPYFIICALLWRDLPLELSGGPRLVATVLGLEAGLCGALLYVWGRRTLGREYQLSGTLGTGLHAGHRLITTGPYEVMRHPMYAGIIVGAVGGLVLYRVWTFVFVLAGVPGILRRARAEDRLLAAAFGEDFAAYRFFVPAWIPRPGCVRRLLRGEPAGPRRRFLPKNLDIGGRVFRGVVVVPGSVVVALSGVVLPVAVLCWIVAVSSAVTALSGHCFLCDLPGRRRNVAHGASPRLGDGERRPGL